jgi:3-phosphoshikimate 1-carboxyvinyltransferase
MKKRPIGILVDALRQLGADITYLEEVGYPPLKIQGKALQGGKLSMDGSVSSQFISALLLIAPALSSPLTVELKSLVSKPYVDLTIALMKKGNAKVRKNENFIQLEPTQYQSEQAVKVEADWSSAAFFYQIMAFSTILKMELLGLKKDSFQGDKRLAEIFNAFGVETTFNADSVYLQQSDRLQKTLQLDLSDCPDLIPSVVVTAAILCENATIKGVQTLRIKESDRVAALKNELSKIGVEISEISDHSIRIQGKVKEVKGKIAFSTYKDHRMAMCLALLVFIFEEVEIENPSVVQKSFPHFWEALKKCGVQTS